MRRHTATRPGDRSDRGRNGSGRPEPGHAYLVRLPAATSVTLLSLGGDLFLVLHSDHWMYSGRQGKAVQWPWYNPAGWRKLT